LEIAMALVMLFVMLTVLEIIGLVLSVNGESGAEAGTYKFWLALIGITVAVGALFALLVL